MLREILKTRKKEPIDLSGWDSFFVKKYRYMAWKFGMTITWNIILVIVGLKHVEFLC